jgi:low affinity Fe/Cu permease
MKTTNSITSLPASPEQDRERRFHRYVWQMSVRVLFFVVAVLMYTWWHTWLCVIPIVLAAVIPWVAVVIANAGNKQGAAVERPAGQIVLVDTEAKAAREAAEDRREAAYREEQSRRRHEAEQEQEAWANASGFRRGSRGRR